MELLFYWGLYKGYIGILENKMETTILRDILGYNGVHIRPLNP